MAGNPMADDNQVTQEDTGAAPRDDTVQQEPSDEGGTPSVEDLRRAYDDLQDRYLRLAADFDNYKKRLARESENRALYAVEQFAVEILEVVDNLERALASDESRLREGLEQIHKLIMNVLEHRGITPIESINTYFDPARQEAIAYIPSDREEGMIIDEIVRGYSMKDKTIRCAKVAVSKGKEDNVHGN